MSVIFTMSLQIMDIVKKGPKNGYFDYQQ